MLLHEPLTRMRLLVLRDLYGLAGVAYFGFSSAGRAAWDFGAASCLGAA